MKANPRALELIDELKDDLFSDRISSSLNMLKILYEKQTSNKDPGQSKKINQDLLKELDRFNRITADINPDILFTESSYSLKEILSNIQNVTDTLNLPKNIPAAHSEEYNQAIVIINEFVSQMQEYLEQKTLDPDIINTIETFENNYHGNCIFTLMKTKADKSNLSHLSVNVGDFCTKIRNIIECKAHDAEITELNRLLNINDTSITVEELQVRLAEISNDISDKSREYDQDVSDYLMKITDQLDNLATINIIQKKKQFETSDEGEYQSMSRKELIQNIEDLKKKADSFNANSYNSKDEIYPVIPDPGPLFKPVLLKDSKSKSKSLKEQKEAPKKPTETKSKTVKERKVEPISIVKKSNLKPPGYLSRQPKTPNTPDITGTKTETTKPRRSLSASKPTIPSPSRIPKKTTSRSVSPVLSPTKISSSPSKSSLRSSKIGSPISPPRKPTKSLQQLDEKPLAKKTAVSNDIKKSTRPRAKSIPSTPTVLSKNRFANLKSAYAQIPKKKKSAEN